MFRHALSILSFSILGAAAVSAARPPAFPGAEGVGRYALGGRGGEVYEVTNLDAGGPGSLSDAVSKPGRIVVFRVSGTIASDVNPAERVTIAGQTAPGDGICIKGHLRVARPDIIVRYIRVRVDSGGANDDGDAVDIGGQSNNVIVDHVSASYSRDETISATPGADRVTVQWCLMSEALNFQNHSYGSLVRGSEGNEKSYHHNLYAHVRNRVPRPGNYVRIENDPEGLHFDFRNNVVYNWGGRSGAYNADGSNGDNAMSRYNFVGNSYIPGPQSDHENPKLFNETSPDCQAWFADNAMARAVPADPWSLVTYDDDFTSATISAYRARSKELKIEHGPTTSAAEAETAVLAEAGCSFPARDALDARIIEDVKKGTGKIIDAVPADGFPELKSKPAPEDGDHDGMPDAWETANGLDPKSKDDQNSNNLNDVYTNIEVYLNWGVFGKPVPAKTAAGA